MVRSGSSVARGAHGWLGASNSTINSQVSTGRSMIRRSALERVGSGFSLIVAAREDSRSSWVEGDR